MSPRSTAAAARITRIETTERREYQSGVVFEESTRRERETRPAVARTGRDVSSGRKGHSGLRLLGRGFRSSAPAQSMSRQAVETGDKTVVLFSDFDRQGDGDEESSRPR